MKQDIDAILKGTDHAAQPVGPLWQIRVGRHAGARADGIGLARELLSKYRVERGEPIAHPEPVSVSGEAMRGEAAEVELQTPPPTPEIVEKVIENPATQERLAEALNEKAELKAALEEALEKLEARKTRVDEFPEELLDLVRENEPHAEALERLRVDYRQLTNRLVDSRLPPLSNLERAYQNRLQKALYSERKGAVEITD